MYPRKDHPARYNVKGFDNDRPFDTLSKSTCGKLVFWGDHLRIVQCLQAANLAYFETIQKQQEEIEHLKRKAGDT